MKTNASRIVHDDLDIMSSNFKKVETYFMFGEKPIKMTKYHLYLGEGKARETSYPNEQHAL
jgi:hypothetical protein